MRLRFRVILATAAMMLAIVAVAAPVNAAVTVTDLAHGSTATQLVQSLVGGGVTVSNATYTGTNNAAGVFTGGNGILGFDSGIVLGSGSVQSTTASGSRCGGGGQTGKGVEGPNICTTVTTNNGRPGDSQLDPLAGFPTFDTSVLQFDFVPSGTSVQLRYVFSSDEYNEYVNCADCIPPSGDLVALFVNGINCALVPGTTLPVSVNTINPGYPIGVEAQNPQFFVNNEDAHLNTEMDGLTTVLTCTAVVQPNQTNHMKIAIADGGDRVIDANVFLQAGSLVSATTTTTTTVPPTTDHDGPADDDHHGPADDDHHGPADDDHACRRPRPRLSRRCRRSCRGRRRLWREQWHQGVAGPGALSSASGQTVTASWSTSNESAVAPDDFVAAAGTVSLRRAKHRRRLR